MIAKTSVIKLDHSSITVADLFSFKMTGSKWNYKLSRWWKTPTKSRFKIKTKGLIDEKAKIDECDTEDKSKSKAARYR